MLTCQQTLVKVENVSPLPKRSGANRKYTNADLPHGSMNNNTWRKKIIPIYIQYIACQDVKETWTIDDQASLTLLQTIWNFIYGAEVPHTIKLNGPAFSIVSFFFTLFPMPTVLFHRPTNVYVNGGLELDPPPLQLSRNSLKIMSRTTIRAMPVKYSLPRALKIMDSSMEVLRRKRARYVFLWFSIIYF
jgi:hypothetical protein